MYKKFLKFIDYFEKFFKRFKVIGYFIVIGFLIFYFIENGFERKEALRVAEKITGLNLEKDILISQKTNVSRQRDSVLNENYFLKEERDSIKKREGYYNKLAQKYKRERNEARDALENLSPNENYRFLQDEAYPYLGLLEFGFNARQVKEMHKTFVENEFCEKELEIKEFQLENCKENLVVSSKIENNSDEAMEMAETEIAVGDSIMKIDDKIIDISMDQWKKNRRKERWNKTKKWVERAGIFIGGIFVGKSIN
jgi:hypothetical protein